MNLTKDRAVAPPVTPAESETTLSQNVLDKLQNSTSSTLDLSRALHAYREAFGYSRREVADRLGVPKKRSYFVKMMALLDVSPTLLAPLEGKKLSEREIERFLDAHPRQSDVSQGQPDVSQRQSDVSQGQPDVSHPSAPDAGGFPLIRDTVNLLGRVVFFWARDLQYGEVAERWAFRITQLRWLRVTAGLICGILILAELRHLRSDLGELAAALGSRLQARGYNKGTLPGAFSLQPRAAFPAPRLIGQRWIAGHRLELRWAPVEGAERYRVYWHSLDGETIWPLAGGADVKTPGAIIAVNEIRGKGLISVTTINREEEESTHSERVMFEPSAVNQQDEVKALPLTGVSLPTTADRKTGRREDEVKRLAAVSPSPRPSVPPSLLPPAEVHAEVRTPDLIRLSWRSVAPDARYNIYSSATRTLTALRKENTQPLKSNVVDWTPETGLERYWIVVTTLDKNGQESAYSEAIEVVRRPEKSDSGADEAARTLRKVLPW